MSARSTTAQTNETIYEACPDGSQLVRLQDPLGPYPSRVTGWLEYWAAVTPARVFLARRHGERWETVSYAQTLDAVQAIGQALLDSDVSTTHPILILSGNGIEHGLLALAATHVGVPFVPVSTAYSLVSSDFVKLREIVALVQPGLIFADDGNAYAAAIRACAPEDAEVVVVKGDPGRPVTPFDALLATNPTCALVAAANAVHSESVAKILFTSGSTGSPKGVISTHRMMSYLLHIMQTRYPATGDEPVVLVDWLPWSHILGGTCSFGMALANGGTLYIDDGKPVPGRIEETVRNLREIAPVFYMSVPKGYEQLLPRLQGDRVLRERFFSRVRILQYSGASVAQHVCDGFDELALATVGRTIPWVALLGSTEGGIIAMSQNRDAVRVGGVGLPGPGTTLKLVPVDGKLEARVKGPCVTPGYWRCDDLTARAFDDDGFLRTGDALDWIDPQDRQKGLRYDGRLAENFKLASGTWVRVGSLRTQLLKTLTPDVRDVVIAGENREYIAVLALPSAPGIADDKAAHARIRTKLSALAAEATGGAQRVLRLAFLTAKLSIDAGELTDKGVLNQRAILRRRAAEVDDLYAEVPPEHVISVNRAEVHTVSPCPGKHAGPAQRITA